MSGTEQPMPPDVNRGGEILAICGTMVGISVFVVMLRIYVRAWIIRQMGPDDWTIIAATTVIFVEMMIIIPQVRLGAGRHWQYIDPPENIPLGLHLNFITQPLCLIALCLTKVSVGLFLLRLTPSVKFRYFIIGTIVFTVLSWAGNFLTVFFQCQPLAFTWGGVKEGKCMPPANLKFAAFFNSSVAVLTDTVFALLPIPMLWNVQLNWRIKIAVAGILSLGVFAAVAAVVKITFLSSYGSHGDFLFDSSDLTIWTTIEICTAIVAASFPCLKPLFRSLFEGSSAGSHNTPGYGYPGGSKSGKGYIRHHGGRHGYPNKSGTGTTDSITDTTTPQFEMYNRTKYTSDVKSGGANIPAPSTTGSEESILRSAQNGRRSMSRTRPDGITKTTAVFVSSHLDRDVEKK